MARPIELVLLIGLGLGVILTGGERRRPQLGYIALGAVLCIAILFLHDVVWVSHETGGKAALLGQLQRWRYLTFTDFPRLLYSAIPGGLLPFLSLALWHKQDRLARQLTIVSVVYLAQLYIQGFVAMHHFVPVMLLPLVVFWRTIIRANVAWPTPIAAAVTAVCLWISLPRRFDVDRTARRIGCRTAYLAGDYMGEWAEHRATIRARAALNTLFTANYGAHPERELLLTPAMIQHYAWRCKTNPATAQYAAVPATSVPPPGMVRVGGSEGVSVFVHDTAAWHADLRTPPPTDWRSLVYAIPREKMHGVLGVAQKNYQLDMTTVPVLWRLF